MPYYDYISVLFPVIASCPSPPPLNLLPHQQLKTPIHWGLIEKFDRGFDLAFLKDSGEHGGAGNGDYCGVVGVLWYILDRVLKNFEWIIEKNGKWG